MTARRWHLTVEGINDWTNILHVSRFNWTNFALIRVEFEASWYKDGYYELALVLFGLGVLITVWKDKGV